MHETDERKRWLDLLDDLGLPPEPQSAPPLPVEKPTPVPFAPAVEGLPNPVGPEVEPVAEAEPEEIPAPRSRRRKAAAAALGVEAEKESPSRPRRKRRVAKTEETPAEEAPAEEPAPVLGVVEPVTIDIPLESVEPVAVDPPPEVGIEAHEAGGDEPLDSDAEIAPNGEDPAKGARRRRRRRRRKSSDAPEGSAVAGREMAEEALEDAEDDEDDAPSPANELVAEVEPAETHTALEEEADEFEDLTNLNMPSWAELVGSLYRPPDR